MFSALVCTEPVRNGKAHRCGGVGLNLLAVVTLLLIVGTIVALQFMPQKKAAAQALTKKTVLVGPFENLVVEQGEVESSSNVEIRCEVKSRGGGGMTILEVVPEGTIVQENDLLLRLDATALEQDYIQQQILCNTSEANMIQSNNTFEAAQIAKTEYLEGTFKQEEQLILGEIFVAEQNLRSAQLAYASAERLSLRGIVTPLQLEGDQFAVDKSRNELAAAQTKIQVLRKYTQAKMLKQLDSDIKSAEAKLNADKKTLELEQSKLAALKEQIDKCTIRAPRSGQVVYANKYSSSRGSSSAEFVVEPGAIVREQQPIIRLPDPGQMQVRTLINESRVNLVRTGMPAIIRIDALQDQALLGEVIKVNQYAEPAGWSSGSVKKYAALVKINEPPSNLRTSMNAEVRVYVERRSEAMQIPLQAVVEHGRKYYCLVANGESFETREFIKGPLNEKFMVVESGLLPGDEVVLNPRSRAELKLPETQESQGIAENIVPPKEASGTIAQEQSSRPRGKRPPSASTQTTGTGL